MNTSVESIDRLKKPPLLAKETNSEEETLAIARTLGAHLRAGDWVALTGELGTGKTLFVRGLGEALKCRGPISSPTFVTIQIYKATGAHGLSLQHVDMYRFSPQEVCSLDWQELFSGGGVTVVEWAEKAQAFWPPACLAVRFSHVGPSRRKLEFYAFGERPVALVQKLKKAVR